MELISIGERFIGELKKKEMAGEVFLARGEGLQFSFSEGKLEDFRLSKEEGVGLRILAEEKIGFAAQNSLALSDALLEKAKINCSGASQDRFYNLSKGNFSYPDAGTLQLEDKNIVSISLTEKMEKVKEQEKIALGKDTRIKKVLRAGYSESSGENAILNTNSLQGGYQASSFSFGIAVLAEEKGNTQVGMEIVHSRFYGDIDFEKITKQAVKKALGLLGAKRVKSGRYSAVFDPGVGCEFLDLIAESFCADSVQKGKSYLKDKINQKVASSLITLVDDGVLPRGMGSAPYDGEGVPTRKKILTENGVLKTFLYDGYAAKKEGRESTGNAGRDSFATMPEPEITNFYLSANEKITYPKEKIIAGVKEGIWVWEVMGLHTADPVSGDFSVGVSGIFIKDGEFAFPVQGMTMAGNLWQLLNSVVMLGNDLTFYGSIGAPTILFSEVTFGGE